MSNTFYTVPQEKLATSDKKLVIKINDEDKMFTVDCTFATYEKITNALNEGKIKESIKLALGAKALKDIETLNLTFEGYMNIVKIIQAAITGIDPNKVDEFFR